MEEFLMRLTEVIKNEREALINLLNLLDEQYKFIMNKDVLSLEDVVDKIRLSSKTIAEFEVERRSIAGDNKMQELINQYNDEDLDTEFRKIKVLLESVNLQKETNELLIKQQMSYNSQILRILNPSREIKTYNSYGNLRR